MNPSEYVTAWEHPPTRRAWLQHMAMNVVGLIGWLIGWIALLGISTRTPDWVVWVFMPYFIYGLYRAVVQVGYFPAGLRMRRILRTYPWQVLCGVPRGLAAHPAAQDDGIWIELPDPTDQEEKIPLVFTSHFRSYWWMRRIGGPRTKPELKAQLEPLWFAGDPRFLGVVAASRRGGEVPRRLRALQQPSALGKAPAGLSRDASPVDLERARNAGARLPDHVAELRK
ncbi:hypothetical protein [Streptomyces silaceus]|uniref:hypothetical protein n=1 Tax=Streptomyces silaceus TaxID=545123 RepID=UPI0006EB5094|nr:hypothetical protein [Streptomyces silaceus]